MSTNAKKTTNRKPRNTAPQAATPEPEAEVLVPAVAPTPAPEAEPLTPAEAADAALERLAEAKARHAEATEALRLAKVAVAETGKAAARAERPGMSCLDAAYQVLLGWAEGRNTKELVKEMAERGLWKSPLGVTPWSTLHAGISREIREKGEAARFVRGEKKGTFAANPRLDPAA